MTRIRPEDFVEALRDQPIIAAVKNDEGLDRALASDCAAVFILCGSIISVADIARRVTDAGKTAFIHADLVEGLASKDIAADFLARNTTAQGIISTRPPLLRRASQLGLITIQRFFLLDSMSFENVKGSSADLVDILPGTMPKVITRLVKRTTQPLIASGLLQDKQDIIAALSAGAAAVSTTSETLWFS